MAKSNKALLSSVAAFAAPNDAGNSKPTLSKADRLLLKEVRAAYEENRGHSLRLTDDAILGIVNTFSPEDWDDMEGEKQLALFEQAEDAFKGIAVSDPGITGLVERFDAKFYAEVEESIEAFIKSKQSILDTLGQLKRVWSKEQFDSCPYPGSTADDVKGTNYSPDIVEKKTVAGQKIRVVFTDDLVNAMPIGKAFQADIDDATKELTTAGSVARIKGKGKQFLRDMIATATLGRNTLRKMVRGAIALHHKISSISEMPLVRLDFIPGTNDKCAAIPKDYRGKEVVKVSRSPKPFWLVALDTDGKEVPNSGRDFSAAQVMAWNPAKALAMPEGGTVSNLIDSAKGEPETPETLGEKMSEDVMDNNVVAINAKLSNTQARAALRKRALEPGNEELRASYCEMFVNLRGFYQANEKWYETYLDGMEKTVEKEKEVKRAANQ